MNKTKIPFEITPSDMARQHDEILATAEHHGIDESNTVVVGGAGLALHGLYTTVPMMAEKMPKKGRSAFDVDAVVVPGSDKWRKGLFGKDSVHYAASGGAPLPLTLIRGYDARAFAYSKFDYPDLETMVADHKTIDGLGVLSLEGILRSKVGSASDRVKDRVGIVGAHLVAAAYENPIVENPYWQSAVQTVVKKLDPSRPDAVMFGVDPMLPGWLNDLRMSGFDHPAFDKMRDAESVGQNSR